MCEAIRAHGADGARVSGERAVGETQSTEAVLVTMEDTGSIRQSLPSTTKSDWLMLDESFAIYNFKHLIYSVFWLGYWINRLFSNIATNYNVDVQ